jgi:hypothetical protein
LIVIVVISKFIWNIEIKRSKWKYGKGNYGNYSKWRC